MIRTFAPACQRLAGGGRASPTDRDGWLKLTSSTEQVRSFLQRLVAEVPVTVLFDPFDSVCPPEADQCSSHLGHNLLFSDSHHLTNAGTWLLYPRFRAFLASPSPAS